jgi:tetratricopeptide (TPR) repeat protein
MLKMESCMNICPRCGKVFDSKDRFCGLCGYNLTVQNSSDFITRHDISINDVQFDLGMIYFKEEKYAEALEVFEKMRQQDPDNLQVLDMYERTRQAVTKIDK